jgi:hypothetical protein
MGDLKFDIVTREVVLENGDFVFESNPSQQNGALMLYSKNGFCLNPAIGIGIESVKGAPVSTVAFEMNRWKKQCLLDSAKDASYKITTSSNDYADVKIEIETRY